MAFQRPIDEGRTLPLSLPFARYFRRRHIVWFYSCSAGGRTICQQLYCKGTL